MTHIISSRFIRLAIATVSLFGLFVSSYLLYTYVSGGPIRCAVTHGCDVVRSSSYAWSYGIPRPLMGVAFYLFLFGLLIARAVSVKWNHPLHRLTQATIVIGLIESIYLFFIQWQVLKAFCFWCLLSGAATIILAILAPFDHPTSLDDGEWELKYYFYLLIIFAILSAGGFYLLVF